MNKKKVYIYIVCFVLSSCNIICAQEVKEFYLTDIISIAKTKSPDAERAKHIFRSKYWRYKTYAAGLLPSLELTSDVFDINRSIGAVRQDDGVIRYRPQNENSSSLALQLRQKIGLTGGSVFASSVLHRLDYLGDNTEAAYMTTPVKIGISQPLFAFNALRWMKKIEPAEYESSKKKYIEAIENVAYMAINYSFNLMRAQVGVEIAKKNYSNADTLYNLAEGRFNLGKIALNDLLQLELNLLNSKSDLNNAKLDLDDKEFELRSFLGYNEKFNIKIIIPDEIPEVKIDFVKALAEAKENNSSIVDLNILLYESEKKVAQARAENRFNANIYASYGLTKSAIDISNAYYSPDYQQGLSLGVSVPVVDWGLGKGKYKMAQSEQEVTRTNVNQSLIDFEQSLMLTIARFNMQSTQLFLAAKSDTIAQNGYEISKNRFMTAKIDVLTLNNALKEKDIARQNYLGALQSYWQYFYTIRRLTLFDFIKNDRIVVDFDLLLN